MGGNTPVRFFYLSSHSFQYWSNWSHIYFTCDAKSPTILPRGNVYYTPPLVVRTRRTRERSRSAGGGWVQQAALELDPCSVPHWDSAALVQETHPILWLCLVCCRLSSCSCLWDLSQVRAWLVWATGTQAEPAQVWHQSRWCSGWLAP